MGLFRKKSGSKERYFGLRGGWLTFWITVSRSIFVGQDITDNDKGSLWN